MRMTSHNQMFLKQSNDRHLAQLNFAHLGQSFGRKTAARRQMTAAEHVMTTAAKGVNHRMSNSISTVC